MMTRRFNPFPNLPRLTPATPTKPATDPRADAARLIVNAGRYRRAETQNEPSNYEPSDPDKRDDKPGKPPEPAPGQLILDAIRRRQEGK
jgi:hypothetical protein